MTRFVYPAISTARGYRYWSRFSNLWVARQKFARLDYSNEWRHSFGEPENPERSVPLRRVVRAPGRTPLRLVVLGDTGEGDRSQYGLVPLLRSLSPDMMIINGDVAYPAGRAGTWRADENDFLHGFFEPYGDFQIPIWATPGNHEFYSHYKGREFYDIFCTRRFDRLWSTHGLRHEYLQPGMFWELDDLENSGLVLVGLDTGKDGNLDGRNHRWQFWKQPVRPDRLQMEWLEQRLGRIQAHPGGRAIVMFHIPALTREREATTTLKSLHRILGRFPCVGLILCAHDHNHQQYAPEVFRRYLSTQVDQLDARVHPRYIVNGGGGGYLESTMYPRGRYPGVRFPSAAEWKSVATTPRQVVGRVAHDKGVLSRLMGIVAKDVFMDYDEPVFLSFILLDIFPAGKQRLTHRIQVTPVFLRALSRLYPGNPRTVHVREADPLPDTEMVKRCLQNREDPRRDQQDLSFEL